MDSFFEGYVGIRGANFDSPIIPSKGNFYVDDLEFIDFNKIAKVDDSYNNVSNLLYIKTEVALEEMSQDLYTYIYKDFISASPVDEFLYGFYNEDITDASSTFKGIRIKVKKTPLTNIYVSTIVLKSKADVVDGSLHIFGDNVPIKTISDINLVADQELEVEVDVLSNSIYLDFLVESDTFEPYNVELTREERMKVADYNTFSRSCGSCGDTGFRGVFLSFFGMDDGAEYPIMKGIKPNIIVKCSLDKAIKLLIPTLLKEAFKYKVGIGILGNYLSSDRGNFFAMNNEDTARELIDKWEGSYRNIMVTKRKSLGQFLKRTDMICFKCGGLTYGEFTP